MNGRKGENNRQRPQTSTNTQPHKVHTLKRTEESWNEFETRRVNNTLTAHTFRFSFFHFSETTKYPRM